MNFRPMLLAAGLLASTAAHAVSTTAQITAESALLGLQLAAKQRAARGLLPPEQAACFQALQPSEYADTVEKIVSTALSPAELAAADQFFNSPPGRKYARHGLLGTYTAVGETPPEPLPEISADEGRAIEAFTVSPVRPSPKASRRAWKGMRPVSGEIHSRRIFSGCSAATSSISTPPSAEATNVTRDVSRSTSSDR